jgi:hypothetical protein
MLNELLLRKDFKEKGLTAAHVDWALKFYSNYNNEPKQTNKEDRDLRYAIAWAVKLTKPPLSKESMFAYLSRFCASNVESRIS